MSNYIEADQCENLFCDDRGDFPHYHIVIDGNPVLIETPENFRSSAVLFKLTPEPTPRRPGLPCGSGRHACRSEECILVNPNDPHVHFALWGDEDAAKTYVATVINDHRRRKRKIRVMGWQA